MSIVIPAGFAQVTFLMSGPGAPTGAACTIGVRNDASASAPSIASNAGSAWEDRIMPEITNDITFVACRAKLGPVETGAFAEISFNTDGDLAGACITPNTSILVTKRTALGGRRGRGRMYIPGAQESDVDEGGILSNARVGDMDAALVLFSFDLVTADLPPFVLHSDGSSSLPAPTAIEDFQTSAVMATQRRRLRR